MSVNAQLTFSMNNIDICNITELKSTFSSDDCVSKSGTGMSSLRYRSHYRYVAPESLSIVNFTGIKDDPIRDHCGCYEAVGSEYDLCLDVLCNKPPECEYSSYDRAPTQYLSALEVQMKNDLCEYSFVPVPSDNVACVEEYRCNWNPSVSGNQSNCMNKNQNNNFFCGVQFDVNDIYFHEIVNISQNECESQERKVCVSPIGSILVGDVSNENCESEGYCTVECPNESTEIECLPVDRRKSSMCYNNSESMDLDRCNRLSGIWSVDYCSFPLQNNRHECERNGNIFIECADLNSSNCHTMNYLNCYLSNTTSKCQSKDECQRNGIAECSDREYFMNYLTSPPTIGVCVVPFLIDGDRQYCYEKTHPLSFFG